MVSLNPFPVNHKYLTKPAYGGFFYAYCLVISVRERIAVYGGAEDADGNKRQTETALLRSRLRFSYHKEFSVLPFFRISQPIGYGGWIGAVLVTVTISVNFSELQASRSLNLREVKITCCYK